MINFNNDIKTIVLIAGAAFIFGAIAGLVTEKRSILIKREENSSASIINISPIDNQGHHIGARANKLSGVKCDNFNRRAYAVMVAEDEEARPLSGIGSADLVIEMSVVTGSVTRMMALFVCEDPREIGSVRSARHDFIALAKGYDAIFAHWGGSHFAQEELATGTIDNLDALPNYFDNFYRKKWIVAPHNGFTSMRRMVYAAQNLGYRLKSEFEGYRFLEGQSHDSKIKTLKVGYEYPYNVKYEYNPLTNSYYRWRGEGEEIDQLNKTQVSVKNIVVMRAKSREIEIEGDYNDVDIIGSGRASVYRNGEEIEGTWTKKIASDALRFYDNNGDEVEFVPGSIWVNVVEPETIINYK